MTAAAPRPTATLSATATALLPAARRAALEFMPHEGWENTGMHERYAIALAKFGEAVLAAADARSALGRVLT